jgi:response regulator RpfG family c-di-GMP phosphodiesterase
MPNRYAVTDGSQFGVATDQWHGKWYVGSHAPNKTNYRTYHESRGNNIAGSGRIGSGEQTEKIPPMIVDNNPWENQNTRLVLKHIQQVNGQKFFQTGWQAFNCLNICRTSGSCPDVILVGLKLHDMSGFSWVEQFERTFWKDFAACYLFLFTHSTLDEDRQKALSRASVKAFLNEPFTVQNFKSIIRPLHVTQSAG